ncbi:serine dehydratase-like [Homarus americanus]|uniref:L-serine ammonia-lyase n=1 Tax=Homarus americanus TaxID=6706 RepID=A0A8J5JDQ8_HOMAM|nr:serine dehydratase-like [Homarus americanus]XP_042205257.1 serine dehydratase-like [Homarus americanus]XP_042205258.1 serine dehydratase-like [Homarus americanus]XP_042205259.1 serine dehydratase-like [Homarus americanus]XP_042205260.1 serine dehydratase-like [Homarus americanus]XP_042205261.1 serine dehydratase-like [Homarus americanus]XP_042205262.1 serine dehydratase-like [Homarus americanus]KAG7155731.1 Serine dehydratase-like [Homarus americanus]
MMDTNTTPQKTSVPLHIVSPLISSTTLSKHCGRQVLLKLDNTQPSGSFKIRGIGNLIQKGIEKGYDHVVTSSGGNAGMAAAYASRKMGIPATVVIPESTPKFMISQLQQENADVIVHGPVWNVAHEKAEELAQNETCCLVHPFDHPDIWEGHSTLVNEILEQSPEKPAAIVVSVGGGGLLCGIMKGLHENNVADISVVAMETDGAHSLNAALKEGKPVSIGDITSIAKTLGSLIVAQGVFDLKQDIQLSSHVISDKQAVEACSKFIDEHRMLVEPACGAALAAGYSGIIQELISKDIIHKDGPIIFVVCGGNVVTLELLKIWMNQFK